MNLPKVSVIIPTYGRPSRLANAINSVLSQTYDNYEIIVVDDNNPNSTERAETENCMIEFLSNPKLKYIKHTKNKNGAAARNTGIRHSSGYYISFLDDDDEFLPSKLEKQVSNFNYKNDYDAVTCGYIRVNQKIKPNLDGNLIKRILMLDYSPVTSSLMFTKESLMKINGFNESFNRHQDLELMIRFLKKFSITSIDNYLVKIGANDGENQPKGNKLEKLKKDFFSAFDKEISRLELDEPDIRKRIASIHYSRVFMNHLKNCYFSLAFKLFINNIIKSPLYFITETLRYIKYSFKVKVKRSKI